MSRLGITGKIWLSVAVFIAGAVAALAVSQYESILGEDRLRVTTASLFPAAQAGQQADAAFERMAKGFQDAVVLEETAALEAAAQDGAAAAAALKAASRLPDVSPGRAGTLEALASGVAALARDGRVVYAEMARRGSHVTPQAEQDSRQLAQTTAALRTSLATTRDALAADLRGALTDTERRSVLQRRTSLLVFLASLVIAGVVVTTTIRRSIAAPIREAVAALTDGARQVTSASSRVSNSAQSLSQGATEQAASLEETSASMEEMASMTRKNAENSRSAAALMADVDAQVRGSNQALGEMVSSMTEIQESSRRVARIMKTIDEIAFQTNILALNAAVEAARAGEAGMGFAVVADEVRNLAQRSAAAAKDTAALIEASIAKAQVGGRKVEQVAGAITAITESVTKVKGLVDEVSIASQQQAQGIEQVSQAVAQMEKVTQTTAATAEEAAAASEKLHDQAETSMSIVARLAALVDGRGGAALPSPTTTTASVARMPRKAAAAPPLSAEDELPFGDTGTYGRF